MKTMTTLLPPPPLPVSSTSAGVIVQSPRAQNPSHHLLVLRSNKRLSTAYLRAETGLSNPEDLYRRPGTERLRTVLHHQIYSQHVVAVEDQQAAATFEGAEVAMRVPLIMVM